MKTTTSQVYAFARDRKVFIRAVSEQDAEMLYLDVTHDLRGTLEAVPATVTDIQRMNALGIKPKVTKAAKQAAREAVKVSGYKS